MSSEKNVGVMESNDSVIIAEESGQTVPLDQSHPSDYLDPQPGPRVDVLKHYIDLQNALTQVRRANALIISEGGISSANEAQIVQHKLNAQHEFTQAASSRILKGIYTYFEITRAGAKDSQLFAAFFSKFVGKEQASAEAGFAAAQEYRRKLIDNVRILQWWPQTKRNREEGLRPHLTTPRKIGDRKPTAEDYKMETRERLMSIKDDPRAGGLPTTRQETNMTISFLDYLDNPDYPFRVSNQFLEVFNRSQSLRRRARNEGLSSSRGPTSITHEIGDYLTNAIVSRLALEKLEIALFEAVNLRVRVGEEEDLMDPSLRPGLIALVRYIDILNFMQKGRGIVLSDPMVTKTDRWDRRQTGTEKDKTVEDSYTRSKQKEPIKDKIDTAIENMTVGEARKHIADAISDQVKREGLNRQFLEIIATPTPDMPRGPRKVLADASTVAQEILESCVALASVK